MAQTSWNQSSDNFIKKKADALGREPHLEFARQCLEEVQTLTSPRDLKSTEVINYEQCIHLVDRLDKAVQKASLFLEHSRHHGGNSVSTEDGKESALERLKILCMLAKKVKFFVQGFCNGHWLQAAVMLTNLSDATASLGFDLKLFTILLPPSSDSRRYFRCPFTTRDVSALRSDEVELVKEMASNDEDSLVTKLRALIRDGQAGSDDLELASFLLERLERSKQGLPSNTPGSLQPILHERDLTNLTHTPFARGASGTVHKASWLGMNVCVKAFYGTDTRYFKNEVSFLAGLSHPNIVPFLGHGKDMGECFIVMELMDQDLFSLMKARLRNDRTRSYPFSVFEEFDVILQIAEAMDYLHEMRVLHRDLKSYNILVRCMKSPNAEGYEEGYEYVQVKMSGFGLSETEEIRMTAGVGTARWMAPELMMHRNTSDILETAMAEEEEPVRNYPYKCDVYSFGMVCLEILTGDLPFPKMMPEAVKRAVCAGERPQIPDRCHERLKALIEKCWNPDPISRPCFGDICAELRHLKSLHLTPLGREPHLEFARQCLEEVQTLTSPRDLKSTEVINYEQCIHLVDRLDKAVQKASLFLEHSRHHGGNSVSTEDGKESALERLKILCMLAKKVKFFVQGFCNGHWLQAAVMLTNLSDATASLGFDLKLFTILLPPSSDSRRYFRCPFTTRDVSALRSDEVELVKEMASNDEDSLVTKLRALIRDGQAGSDDLELASFLLERLERSKQGLPSNTPGSLQPILHERDLTNLTHTVPFARGASGTVYRASWLGMDVCVKAFYGTDTRYFKNEVSFLAGLSHPNIVPFLGHGKDMGECFIVMELMDQDLFSLMKARLRNDRTRSYPFSVFEEFDVILQIAEAMDYLHEMRVLHRDLKSYNILVRCMKSPNAEGYEEGYEYVQVKMSGFGLSETEEIRMTAGVGTARWMAPELMMHRNTSDILETAMAEEEEPVRNYPYKCDVYSFGMVCLEILTGDLPFPKMMPEAVKRAVCAGERPQIPDRCHERLKALIEKCWNPDPISRPCFGDICAELRHLKSLHLTRKTRKIR